jgi:hypothetical protein
VLKALYGKTERRTGIPHRVCYVFGYFEEDSEGYRQNPEPFRQLSRKWFPKGAWAEPVFSESALSDDSYHREGSDDEFPEPFEPILISAPSNVRMLPMSMSRMTYGRTKSSPKLHLVRLDRKTLCGHDVVGELMAGVPAGKDYTICIVCSNIRSFAGVRGGLSLGRGRMAERLRA